MKSSEPNKTNLDTVRSFLLKQAESQKNLIDFVESEIKKQNKSLYKRIRSGQVVKSKYAKEVLEMVSRELEVTMYDLESINKQREIVEARHIYSYLIKNESKIKVSLEVAGSAINRDHATIIYGATNAETLIKTNKTFREKFNRCLNRFKDEFLVDLAFVNDYNYVPQL